MKKRFSWTTATPLLGIAMAILALAGHAAVQAAGPDHRAPSRRAAASASADCLPPIERLIGLSD